MKAQNGRLLKRVMESFNPFNEDGSLIPENKRRTMLASNSNLPSEIESRAFTMASAAEPQSPQIIQVSYNCAKTTGSNPGSYKFLPGVEYRGSVRPAAVGAARARQQVDWCCEDFGARMVFVSLDHFSAPKFSFDQFSSPNGDGGLPAALARALLDEAIEVLKPITPGGLDVARDAYDAYINFLTSDIYGEYRADFLQAVMLSRPAWAMMDTGGLPTALNFATSRDLSFGVRKDIGNDDCVIEAEISATGASGKVGPDVAEANEPLDVFIDRVCAFVELSRAEGIAYEIGMQHAAKKGEKHEPDVEKLTKTQWALWQRLGRYVPFVQHGGTGAATLLTGLVGKNNINTMYLVEGANFFADHYESDPQGVRDGLKKACGTGIYTGMTLAIAERCVQKLKEANTFGVADDIEKELGLASASSEVRQFADIEARE